MAPVVVHHDRGLLEIGPASAQPCLESESMASAESARAYPHDHLSSKRRPWMVWCATLAICTKWVQAT